MGIGSIIGVFGLEDSLAAEGVDEGCSTWSHLSIVVARARKAGQYFVPVPDAPQTIKQN
jgi:hypothetical protein